MAAYFVLASLLLCCAACEKPEDDLGLALTPQEDLLGLSTIIDSVDVQAYTVLADSARTSALSRAMIGDLEHPVFGSTQSSLYTQIRLSALSVDFAGDGEDSDVIIDSLVLALSFYPSDSAYGEVDAMNFSVKRIIDEAHLEPDTIYYSDDQIEVGEELLGDPSAVFLPNPADSVDVGGERLGPQLRFILKDEFAQELLSESQLETSAFDDVSEFLDFFRGVEVSAERLMGDGSILTFDLLHPDSKMTLYYQNADEDSLEFDFNINASAQRFLHFEHDYSASPVQTLLDDPGTQDEVLYMHASSGLNVIVDLSTVLQIADTADLAFNKVEIVIPVDESADPDSYEFPNRMFAVYQNDDGNTISIPDIFEGEIHSDGFYDEDANEYRVNVTRFAQQLATGVIDTPMIQLIPVNNSITPNFVPLKGVGVDGGARLIITYTEYE